MKRSSERQLTGFLGADQQPFAGRPESGRVEGPNLDEVVGVWPQFNQLGVVPLVGGHRQRLGRSLAVLVAPPVLHLEPTGAPLSVWMKSTERSSDCEPDSPGNRSRCPGKWESTKRWRLWRTGPCRRSWRLPTELRGQRGRR